jgi:hypothetical protein
MNPQSRKDFARLRASVGGDSQFMSAHGIRKVRTAFDRCIPEWTQSDEAVRRFLLATFPVLRMSDESSWGVMKLRIALMPRRQRDRAQREIDRAVRVHTVLTLVYRLRLTDGEAADEVAYMFIRLRRKSALDAVKDALKVIRGYRP